MQNAPYITSQTWYRVLYPEYQRWLFSSPHAGKYTGISGLPRDDEHNVWKVHGGMYALTKASMLYFILR